MRVNLNLFPEELLPAAPLHCPLELLDLLDWAIDLELLRKGADVGHLHQWCMTEGLSVPAWRLLAKFGERAYQAVLDEYPSREGRFMQCLSFVEWQARAGLVYPLPAALGQQLVMAGRHAGLVPPVDPRVIRAVARHWVTLRCVSRQVQFASEEWAQVLLWMRDKRPGLDSNQWRSGWAAIWREYGKWTAISSAQGQWEPVLESFADGPYTIAPLANAADVVREGWEMRHCAADYVDLCKSGQYLLFSVTLAKTGKHAATVGIRKTGKRWKVDQVSGKANREAEPNINQVARLIRKYVNEQESGRNALLTRRKLVRQIERMGRIDIRVGWEGGGAPLMVLEEQFWQHIDLNQLPIGDNLRERLEEWTARFRSFPPCQIIDERDWNEMDDQLRGFAAELKCVLGPEYRVVSSFKGSTAIAALDPAR